MRKPIVASLLIAFLLVACKKKANRFELMQQVTKDFYERTRNEVKKYDLLKKDNYTYVAILELADENRVELEISVDIEQPQKCIWRITNIGYIFN